MSERIQRYPWRATRIGPALALALAMSACASGAESPGEVKPSMDSDPPPVDDLTQALFGDPSDWDEKMAAVSRNITECMHDRGWNEFQPIPGSFQLVDPDTAAEYRDENGYGVSTDIGSDVVDRGDDPNDQMIASMTLSERAQFDRSLWDPLDAQQPGCMFVGHESVFGSTVAFSDDFGRITQQAQSETAADPRYIGAQSAWSDCMADAGYTAFSENDLIDQLVQELNSIAEGGSPEEIDPNDERLLDLQAKERRIARAADECQVTSRSVEVYTDVLNEKTAALADECPACFGLDA